jgi:hypothetical protein
MAKEMAKDVAKEMAKEMAKDVAAGGKRRSKMGGQRFERKAAKELSKSVKKRRIRIGRIKLKK